MAGLVSVPLLAVPSGATGTTDPSAFPTSSSGGAIASPAVQSDTSPPLRDIKPVEPPKTVRTHDHRKLPVPPSGPTSDPIIQSSTPATAGATTGSSFLGVGFGFTGPAGTFSVNSAPPDTNGAVGATQFVEIVNQSFAVFDKSTQKPTYGPAATNTLFTGFGGGCQTNDDGDGTVKYDQLANRWIITQFSVSTTPYLQCVAVSQTSDATGAWNRYSFQYGNFPDYPKLSVWPDAYYITFNMFHGNRFVGAEVCAYDRARMVSGLTATQVCFALSSTYGGLLPSDLDGSSPPPGGSPDYLLNFGSNSLNRWMFHVDFSTPANSTLAGPTSIPVAAFSAACGGGTCIPQPGTTQQLDSLADRLMYRLAYRNFGDHESLVVTHSVNAGNAVGVRWYELRSPGATTPTVYQQGTFAPDNSYRWMGSIAMDRFGDTALGYSVSSSSTNPAIGYTGRVPGDTLGTMETETPLIAGGGSQLANLSRWGDYTSLAVDPVDDCTFWYTNEYLQSSGTFNWSTRIATFKFPNCPPPPPAPSGLTATAVSANQVNLSWAGSAGATGYKVERSTDNFVTFTQIAAGVAGTTYNDTDQSLRLPGTAGNYASAPSSTALSITGDIDLRARVALDSWTPATPQSLITKFGDTRSYWFGVDPGGILHLEWSSDGTNDIVRVSTVRVGVANHSTKWVRATLKVNNGAGGHEATFYVSDDGVSWQQLGAVVTTTGTTAIFGGSYPVQVGTYAAEGQPMAGNVYYAEIRNGINGSVVGAPNFGIATNSFSDSYGNNWTIVGPSAQLNSGLAAGTTYYYRVRATNTAGDSTYTNTSSATTL